MQPVPSGKGKFASSLCFSAFLQFVRRVKINVEMCPNGCSKLARMYAPGSQGSSPSRRNAERRLEWRERAREGRRSCGGAPAVPLARAAGVGVLSAQMFQAAVGAHRLATLRAGAGRSGLACAVSVLRRERTSAGDGRCAATHTGPRTTVHGASAMHRGVSSHATF